MKEAFSIRVVIGHSIQQYLRNFKQFFLMSIAINTIAALWIVARFFMEWSGMLSFLKLGSSLNILIHKGSIKWFILSLFKQISLFSPVALASGMSILLIYGVLYCAQEVVICGFVLRISGGSKVTFKNVFFGMPFYGWFIIASGLYLTPFISFEWAKFVLEDYWLHGWWQNIYLLICIALYWFAFPLYLYGYCMIDKKLKPLRALSESYRIIKKARIKVFFLYILVNFLFTLFFGLLFSLPYIAHCNLFYANLPVVYFFLQGFITSFMALVFANVYRMLEKND